ncbi:MAG: hypothetical protein R2713_18730 [Ilumatobacteraceae bacterium]
MSSVWANLGFTFIVVTAGLQSIPAELYESVRRRRQWLDTFHQRHRSRCSDPRCCSSVWCSPAGRSRVTASSTSTGGGPQRLDHVAHLSRLRHQLGGSRATTGSAGGGGRAVVRRVLALSILQIRGVERRIHYGD